MSFKKNIRLQILAGWLILLLGLPSPLFALRQMTVEGTGLEELQAVLAPPSVPSLGSGRVARRWDEPTSRDYSRRLVREFNQSIGQERVNAQRNGLHNEVTRESAQPFLEKKWWGELRRGSQRRGVEKWVDRRGGVYFIRIGPLFFVDDKKAAFLNRELLAELGANAIRINDLTSSRLADSPLLGRHERVGPYTYPAIAALLETDVAGKVLFDAGSGRDVVFALIGKAFGAAAVVAIESDGRLARQARVNFAGNHLQEGADFFLIQADLTQPEEIRRELEVIQAQLQQVPVPIKEAVLVSSTGTWPFYTANNRSSIALIPIIAQATGLSVTSVIGSGLVGDWQQMTAGQAGGELLKDIQAVERHQGLKVAPDLFLFSATGTQNPSDHFYTVAWLATSELNGSYGFSSTGLEEKISAEEAKARIDRLKTAYDTGTPLRQVSKDLSDVVLALIRGAEEQARKNLEQKVTVIVSFVDGTSKATAFDRRDSSLTGKSAVTFKGRNTFTAVTGGLGRGDDFLFRDDIDVIVFPSDEDSILYAQALQQELIGRLENSLQSVGIPMRVDHRLTGQFNFQIPPAQVPEKLLIPRIQVYEEILGRSFEAESALTTTPFRDLRFVSGDRTVFERMMKDISPLLYPYDAQGQVADPKGHELIRILLSSGEEDRQRAAVKESSRLDQIDLKEDALRQIQRYVWVERARVGVRVSSVFDALEQFVSKGALSANDAEALSRAYEFFLKTRNALLETNAAAILAAILKGAWPDYRVPAAAQPHVSKQLGMSSSDFAKEFSIHFGNVKRVVSERVAAGLEEGQVEMVQETDPKKAEPLVAELVGLAKEVFREHPTLGIATESAASLAGDLLFRPAIQRGEWGGPWSLRIIRKEGRIIAYLVTHPSSSGEPGTVELSEMGVHLEDLRTGLASRLLDGALASLASNSRMKKIVAMDESGGISGEMLVGRGFVRDGKTYVRILPSDRPAAGVGLEEIVRHVVADWTGTEGNGVVVVTPQVAARPFFETIVSVLPPELARRIYVEQSGEAAERLRRLNPGLNVVSGTSVDVVMQVIGDVPTLSSVRMLGADSGLEELFKRSAISIQVFHPGVDLEVLLFQMGTLLGVSPSQLKAGMEEMRRGEEEILVQA